MSAISCPRCYRERWHATGRFDVNRHGRRRAELVCDACGYAFSNGREEAIAAAQDVPVSVTGRDEVSTTAAGAIEPPAPVHVQRAHSGAFTSVAALARDFKSKATGDES